MTVLRVAAVQASYTLMDRDATIDRVAVLTADAAAQGADLIVFPEVFVPGTPIWIDTRPVWDGDDDWFGLLADNAVVVPGPASERLAAIAAGHHVWLVVGVDERDRHGSTIYNTVLYFSPAGELAARHRKLVPTGSERTVWGMGDGSTLPVLDTGAARISGLTCWENYMPLARFYLYAQGVDVWIAPTLAQGDGWIATMRHLARENRMFVLGVNPVLHADQIPAGFPARDLLVPPGYLEQNGPWLEEGNTVIVAPDGTLLAGPVRRHEETLVADLDLREVAIQRHHIDPVGHYNRPDIFRLHADTARRNTMNSTPLTSASSAERLDARPDVLVDAGWLEAHLTDPAVRIVEVDVSRAAHDQWHIGQAALWNVYTDLKDSDYRLVGPEAVRQLLETSGITPETTVVFYGYAPAMGFWLMKLYRHADVRILDCSRDTWQREGRPCDSTPSGPAAASYPLGEQDGLVRAGHTAVLDAVGDRGTTILDVRGRDEYRGGRFWPSGGMEPGGRAGHIPSAVHQPVDDLYDDRGAFRPADGLRGVFRAADQAAGELITYCTIGGRASTAWFVLTYLLGRDRVRVYDGSWAEWGRMPGTPVDTA